MNSGDRFNGGNVDVQKNKVHTMSQFSIIVEQHPDGYIAYPVGLNGIVIGQGETYQEALDDVTSAIRYHIETFGNNVFQDYDLIGAELTKVLI